LQIAEALGIGPNDLLQKEKKRDEGDWLFRKDHTLHSLLKKEEGYSLFNIVSNDKTSAYLIVINAGAELDSHFLSSKKNEIIHVLKGIISVKIENSEKMLSHGDSIYLKHSLPSG
jgi:quercetin dioxygenase-like cupin family protein